jgi:hypothetical protein
VPEQHSNGGSLSPKGASGQPAEKSTHAALKLGFLILSAVLVICAGFSAGCECFGPEAGNSRSASPGSTCAAEACCALNRGTEGTRAQPWAPASPHKTAWGPLATAGEPGLVRHGPASGHSE